ncbi:MAG: hypothetical protein P8181_14990 [bacterium]
MLRFRADVDSLEMTFYIVNPPYDWTITSNSAWVSTEPSSGTGTTVTVMVRVDRTGLADGLYRGELQLSSRPVPTPVEMVVAAGPLLSVTPPQMDFNSGVLQLPLGVSNIGMGVLDWSVSEDQPWIKVNPTASGSGDRGIFVLVDTTAVPAGGVQTGQVTVTSNGGTAGVAVRYDPDVTYSPGVVGLYVDYGGSDCNLSYGGPGLFSVHVVHSRFDGATALQFAAPRPFCWTGATWLSDTDAFPIGIGNSQTGKAVGYGMCFTTPAHVTTVNYFVGSPTNKCCLYPVLPDFNISSGRVETVDCSGAVRYAHGGYGMINPNASCACSDEPVPVEKTTWGRLREIYR